MTTNEFKFYTSLIAAVVVAVVISLSAFLLWDKLSLLKPMLPQPPEAPCRQLSHEAGSIGFEGVR